MGDHILIYAKLVDIIVTGVAPMFKRDVIKRDRQDDQAMERYLSGEMITFVADDTPQELGFIVYLYLFGELHSAVQSRSLPHGKRVEMLLTVEYFFQGWVHFIAQHPDYGLEQVLSATFFGIVKKLIRGLLGLMYVFQDRNKDHPEPFLP